MFNKKFKLAAIGVSVALLLGACSGGNPSADAEGKEYNLKMSLTVADSSTWFEAAEEFRDKIKEESNGRINIELYPNEQLTGGDQAKGVEALAKGSTDLSFHSTIIYSALDQKFSMPSAPFLFKNYEEVDAVMKAEGGEALAKIVESKGIKALGFGESGFRQLTNNGQLIKSPEDLKGLKIRIPGMTMYTDLFRELNADPLTMNFAEVFTSLQQGTIDAQENPVDIIYSSKLNEVQDYMTLWNYSYDPLVLGINKKLYDSMSDEDKELFDRLGKEAAERQVELSRQKTEEQIQLLKDSGMEVYEPTDAELNAFNEAVQGVYVKYAEVWGKELTDAFIK